MEDSILAVSDTKLISLWLQVDVAGVCFQRIHENVVHDTNRDGHVISAHLAGLATLPHD
jgi:hypothetical protein